MLIALRRKIEDEKSKMDADSAKYGSNIKSDGTTLHLFRPHARTYNSCSAMGPQDGEKKLQR